MSSIKLVQIGVKVGKAALVLDYVEAGKKRRRTMPVNTTRAANESVRPSCHAVPCQAGPRRAMR